ncbi:penicillin-binding protein activator [Lacimicrobium sp. SS2-24]|uniref:penicillin-binding protein activator n=1 Tax=Lacimicrobium sp. SS2-24 TaxID=2005569 RepID=UPI00143A803F|nr:penicillin-binding protein activator [Lacimicrobium sp. SS2-24]
MLNLRNLTVCLTITLLSACASAPDTRVRDRVTELPQSPRQSETVSAEELYAKARQAPAPQQAGLLLQAVKAWHQEGRCETVLKVLRPLLPELRDNLEVDQARLLRSECLLELEKPELAAASLEKVSRQLQILPARLKLSAALATYRRDYLSAANDLAELLSLDPAAADTLYPQIWSLLEKVDSQPLRTTVTTSDYLSPWMELSHISRQAPVSDLQWQVEQWQQRYPDLPLPRSLQQLQQPYAPQRVAVILPLSGRLGNQGQALKEGMLAAYFVNSQTDKPQLSFYDSVLLDETRVQQLALEHDFVIGPLLRENIPTILSQLPESTPALMLNRVETENPAPHHYFYSLAPEDEAEQLASYLHSEGYGMPVLITTGRPLYERMAEHFIQQWQKLERRRPKLFTFTDNKSMREAVDAVLSIDQSERRIRVVERLVNKEVYSFARNRRDVDAIVVFANPSQTELLNPMIESSISPFASIIPVFASSRSFSQELSNNSLRDLRNLVFVDMPWMLPGKNSEFKATANALWPDRNDSQNRLFAMGYDAYNLVPDLMPLRQLKGRFVQGLTGELTLDRMHRVIRRLPFGKIEQDRVVAFEGN